MVCEAGCEHPLRRWESGTEDAHLPLGRGIELEALTIQRAGNAHHQWGGGSESGGSTFCEAEDAMVHGPRDWGRGSSQDMPTFSES